MESEINSQNTNYGIMLNYPVDEKLLEVSGCSKENMIVVET